MTTIDRRTLLGSSLALAVATPLAAQPRRQDRGEYTQLIGDSTIAAPVKGLRTKFACNIEMWGFGTGDHAERIRKAADLGFQGVEFWPWRGKDLDALAKAAKDTKVEITQFVGWGFDPGLNDAKNHDAFLKEIEASCATANRLGAKWVLCIAGNDQPGMTKEQMHQNVIDGLKKAVPIAEKHDVILMIEPLNTRVDHRGHCLSTSPDMLRIAKAVGSKHVKVCWDFYHLQVTEGDLCGHLKEGIDEICYIQFADYPGRHEPGTGEIRYNQVFKAAAELGYKGWWGAELSPLEGELKAAERLRAADTW